MTQQQHCRQWWRHSGLLVSFSPLCLFSQAFIFLLHRLRFCNLLMRNFFLWLRFVFYSLCVNHVQHRSKPFGLAQTGQKSGRSKRERREKKDRKIKKKKYIKKNIKPVSLAKPNETNEGQQLEESGVSILSTLSFSINGRKLVRILWSETVTQTTSTILSLLHFVCFLVPISPFLCQRWE